MSIPRSISILILFSISVVTWIALLVFSGSTGFPSRLLLSQACYRPEHELARIAFDNEQLSKPEYFIVGTPEFVKQIKGKASKKRNIIAVPLQALSFSQYTDAVRIGEYFQPDLIILQNAPHLWIDINTKKERVVQNTLTWDLYQKDFADTNLITFALQNLRVLQGILKSPCQKRSGKSTLPSHFLWTSFLPEPLFSQNIAQYTATTIIEQKTVWVFDPLWIPKDTMPDTYQQLIEFCSKARHVKGLGKFISIGDPFLEFN